MSPPTSGTATPGSTTFVSHDLNASVSGRILSQAEPGKVEGLQLELDAEGIQIKHPSLVSITTKPDSQTLHSINTGLPLLTLATPLLPPSDDASSSDAALEPSPPRPARNVVTLHEGLLSDADASLTESSPFFSTTFSILIDSPSFPPPHFDPTSVAPPTPSVKAYDPSSSSASGFGGVLNSPTLQRALLSPLLSPQRRAASQGSDISVPPLSLGLSRTSRQSFSADRPARPPPAAPTGLPALIPALAPPPPPASAASLPPADPAPLAAALTAAISHSAKKTAEDILVLRRAHDAYVRRAKAELDVLEARIELARSGGTAGAGGAPGAGGVVRGFGVPPRGGAAAEPSRRSESGSGSRERERERGRSGSRNHASTGGAGGRGGSVERSPLGPGREADTRDQPQQRGRPAASAMNRDEDVSYRLREQDQREEDERGRSRSRQRWDSSQQQSAAQRSRSRTKALAEATEAAAKVAVARGTSGSRERERKTRAPPVEGENIPATLEEDEEEGEEDHEEEHPAPNGLLSPASAATLAGHKSGGTTPTFVASTSNKGLVAIPETEELLLPPSEASRSQTPEQVRQRENTAEGGEHDQDAPFEMDEDVEVDAYDLSRPIFQQQPPDDEPETEPPSAAPPPPLQHQSASTFKPGSYQRASSLSASYAALLSSSLARQAPSDASDSPSRSPSQAFSPSSAARRGDPALSPPGPKVATATSAREDARIGASLQSRTSPDPRDVRKGEQKIRDVLAMDVPSHRQALPRRRPSGREGTPPSPRSRSRSDDGEDESEADDTVDDRLGASTLSTTTPSSSAFQVGSLPIALAHRPSTHALSSWRPDPERAWAAERERRKSSAGPAAPGPREREPATWVPPSSLKAKSTGGKLEGAARGTEVPSVPLEIGPSRTAVAHGQGQGQGPGGDDRAQAQRGRRPVASSLAQSLRNAPPGSFVQRSTMEAEERRNGVEQLDVGGGAEGDDGDDDGEDDDEAAFVPPHMVAERRARKDERFLSRSISRS
ncbi:hypothetical protein JCM21900_006557 [Sporobolomyces salmonicolor]